MALQHGKRYMVLRCDSIGACVNTLLLRSNGFLYAGVY